MEVVSSGVKERLQWVERKEVVAPSCIEYYLNPIVANFKVT